MDYRPTRRELFSGSALVGPIRARAKTAGPREHVHFSRRAMACEFSVCFPAAGDRATVANRSIHALQTLDLVDAIESQLSIFRDDSEISRLNRSAAHDDFTVESQLYGLLKRSGQLWHQTDGAFDITAGPLSRIWGFQTRQPRIPDPAQIAEALALVGSDKLIFNDDRQSVRFAVEGLAINLGGIGKGYALDRCASALCSAGETTFLLQGGHSSVLGITEPDASPWQIDLRYPLGDLPRIASIYLTDQAMATSGGLVQRVSCGHRTFGHIIDPRTGWPTDGLVTATAFAETAADADALATAFYLMGVETTIDFCERHPAVGAILVVEADCDVPFEVQTAGRLPEEIVWET